MRESKFKLRINRDGEILTYYKTIEELIDGWFNTIQYNSSLKIISKDQYTGLEDKNGKEIYEGDVLLDADNSYINTVEFSNGSFVAGEWDVADFKYLEVIGNIYENPELLK